MVRQVNKIVISIVVFTLCSPHNLHTSAEWEERNPENLDLVDSSGEIDKIRCLGPVPGLCKVNRELPQSLVNYFSKRKSIFINGPIMPHRCSCQMVKKMMILGGSYYPRILENWVCKNDSCGIHHRCVEKKYTVQVLKLNDFSDIETEPMCYAANLRGSWVPKAIKVGVACECAPVLY